MKKVLLCAVVGVAFATVACEQSNRRADTTRDTTTANDNTMMNEDTTSTGATGTADRTMTENQTDTATTASADMRYRVTKIDRENNQVTLAPAETGDTTGADVQRTAGREKTMSFDELKTKASLTGDINSLREGQEITLRKDASMEKGTDTDANKMETNTDTNTQTP